MPNAFSAVLVRRLKIATLYDGNNYTTIDVPGAFATYAYGISGNNIVGYYEYNGGSYNGFLYNGVGYTPVAVPGALQTRAYGISGSDIVGFYQNNNSSVLYGFLYNGSSYTTLAIPGASDTFATGVSGGNVVGYYYENGNYYGFLYNGSSYTTLTVNGGSTIAWGISGDVIVGDYGSQGFEMVVPEPSSWALFGCALATMKFVYRRRGAFLIRSERPFRKPEAKGSGS